MPTRVLRLNEVLKRTGPSRSALYEQIKLGRQASGPGGKGGAS